MAGTQGAGRAAAPKKASIRPSAKVLASSLKDAVTNWPPRAWIASMDEP